MPRWSLYILSSGLVAAAISTLYFLMLMCGAPFVAIVPVIGICVVLMCRFFLSRSNVAEADNIPLSVAAWATLMAGMALLIWNTYPVAEKYGGWDAWAIWSYHARFLAHPEHWKTLLTYRICHPDYPMLVPGFAGFFARLTSVSGIEMYSFVLSFSITLFIPVLIYAESVSKNIVVAAAALLILVTNTFYVSEGVSLYADIVLAFFFLGALVSVKYAQNSPGHVVMAACCLGACLWTKNEGVILVILFIVFHFRELMLGGSFKYFVAGIIVPLITLIFFKTCYAPPNDMIANQTHGTLMQVFDGSRYRMIWNMFAENMSSKFEYMTYAIAVYLAVCILWLQWPDKRFIMLMSCLAAYCMVYVVSVEDLKWHLYTSQNRLMLQLAPALLYVMADTVAFALRTKDK